MNLTASEKATLHFYEWEHLGRGYYHFDDVVAIEPPFIPFSHKTYRDDSIDDGKIPSLFGRFSKLLNSKNEKEEKFVEKEIIPNEEKPTKKRVGFSFSFGQEKEISAVISVELLNMLSYSRNSISFEILGSYDAISVQFVCAIEDKVRIQSQLQAYFPHVIIQEFDVFDLGFNLQRTLAITDYSLENEFVMPITMTSSFALDPFTSIIATLDNLQYGDTVLFQIIFKGVTAPWSKNMLYAVSDGVGGSFFADCPEMLSCTQTKVSSPLFSAVIRTVTQGNSDERSAYLMTELARSIARISNSEFNRLIPLSNEGYSYDNHLYNVYHRTSNRLGMILSSHELVSFVHYPNKNIVSKKLGFQGGKTKRLPTEVFTQKYILGVNEHNKETVSVTINDEARLRHCHIIGVTGVGKSTLIANMMLEDMKHGNGCALFDPHGDIVEDILNRIPEHRKDDVIIIDPSDSEFPIGFNLLGATTDAEKIVLSSDLVSAFKQHATAWGDNMSAVLSQVINAFLESNIGGTLIELKRFLLEDSFRKQFLKTIDDPSIHYYWEHEYKMVKKGIAPLLTRIDTFLRPKIVRYMLAQKSGIDFKTCIDEKKIVLIKLSQGLIGEDNSYLLGSLFLSKFNQVARGRQSLSKKERHPYYIYLDEFQNFITPSITSILSGARKYGLGLILAHQELAQIDDTKILNSVISNPYSRICFRLGDVDAKRLESGFSYFEQNDLQSLGIGEAIMRVGSSNNDFNIKTFMLPEVDIVTSSAITNYIIENTRRKYAKPRAEIEELLINLLPKISPKVISKKQVIENDVVEKLEVIQKEIPVPINKDVSKLPDSSFEKQKKSYLKQESKQDVLRNHRSLQNFVRTMALQRGFNVSLEKETQDGGRVDVSLIRDSIRIAIEISVTNTVEYEVKNIQKCINDNYSIILMVSEDTKHLQKIKKLSKKLIESKLQKNIFYITPDEISLHLDIINTPKEKTPTKRVNGWRVKVSYHPDDNQQKNQDSLSKRIRNSLK